MEYCASADSHRPAPTSLGTVYKLILRTKSYLEHIVTTLQIALWFRSPPGEGFGNLAGSAIYDFW